jgi:GTP cyclohydrolase I
MIDPVRLDVEGVIGEFDEKRAENAVRELLIAVGEDPDREGLRETPGRVARAYKEIFAGLWQTPEDVLTTTFDLGHDEMILVKDIEVFSTCEHHLVPFRGVAHVGYIPSTNGKITGMCMSMRGIRKPGAKTITSAVRGQLRDAATRNEAMSLIMAR